VMLFNRLLARLGRWLPGNVVDQPELPAHRLAAEARSPKGCPRSFMRLSNCSRRSAVTLPVPPHSRQIFLRNGKRLSTRPVALQIGQSVSPVHPQVSIRAK